jgi:hypothetical protein
VAAGGSSSGGTSSTDPGYEGDCADKPTYAAWRTQGTRATGDTAIFQCTKSQGACVGLPQGEDYLFTCVSTHVPNCEVQDPDDAFSWEAIDSCAHLVPEGMGGLGGGAP